jgi:[acyl-carrier-protein] S-malonyltransferase
MGLDLVKNFKVAKDTFEEASEGVKINLLKLCKDGPVEELNRTELTQPAILTMSMAAYRVLDSESDFRPDFLAGHSLGEYTAVAAGGGMGLADAVSLVRKRGRYMQEAVPEGEGTMAAILGMELDELEEICNEVGGIVVPANLNCPGQIVISGEITAVEDVAELSRERGAKRTVILDVSGPFHSPLMKPAAERLKEALDAISISDLQVPLINNVEARAVQSAEEIREGLLRQLTAPLLWEKGVREMIAQGVETFIEVGPGRVLSSLILKVQRKVKVISLAETEGLDQIRKAAANREV